MDTTRTYLSRAVVGLLLVACSVLGLPALAQAATVTSVVFNNVSNAPTLNAAPASAGEVDDLSVRAGGTLYLPSSADVRGLTGWVVRDDGSRAPFAPGDYQLVQTSAAGDWTLTFTGANAGAPITVRQSARVPAMFVRTGSGLSAIEADKGFEDTGATMAMVDPGASTLYNDALEEMKGRGNTTWTYPKKPYQVKLDSSTELVANAGKHKTWILLANYLDASLLRNKVAYDLEGAALARAGASDHSIKGRMVDLFIDGGFRGSYYLTEKVQVGATRLAITDLEKANEAANPDLSSYDPTWVSNPAGAPGIREAGYVPFPNTPAGYESSGYLLEMDFATPAREENSYVITRHGTPFVLKGPEDANAAEVTFIGNRLQKLEDALYSPSGRNAEGTHFSELLDVDSWARYYAIQETIANDDAFKSSTYLYLDAGGKLKAGPLWDADRTLGSLHVRPKATEVHVGKPTRLKPRWINELLAHASFRAAVQKVHREVIAPEVSAILAPRGYLNRDALEVERSATLNKARWEPSGESIALATPAQDIAHLRDYLRQRHHALETVFSGSYTAGTLVADGHYTLGNQSLTLDIDGGSMRNEANVHLWSPNGSGAQTFALKRGTDALYSITNVNSLKSLDVRFGQAAAGTNVWQYAANDSLAQKWRISTLDGARYTITSLLGREDVLDRTGPEEGFVLEGRGSGTANGTNVRINTATGAAGQRFSLNPVTLPARPANGATVALASALDPSRVLDVQWASPANGTNIQLWSANGSPAQRFTVRDAAGGTVELVTGTGPNNVVEVQGGGRTNGTNVWQYARNGSAAQRWTMRPTGDRDGSFYLVSQANGLHLDVANGRASDGSNIWVWEANGSPAQKFRLR